MTPPPDRGRYAPALRQFMERLDQDGLSEMVRQGRSDEFLRISALVRLGVVSSISVRAGDSVCRLRFTRAGRALRKLLLAEAARA